LQPFRDEPHACALLSGGGERWSYLLRAPQAVLTLDAADPRDPFEALSALIGPRLAADPEGPPFQGGVVGLGTYELGDRVERLGLGRTGWPDLTCALYPALLSFDHQERRVVAVGRGDTDAQAGERARAALAWLDAPVDERPPVEGPLCPALTATDGEAYEVAVADVVARIHGGEIFQANIARAWRGRLAAGTDPFDLFLRLRAESPAPFSAFLRLPDRALVSNSPERFLRVQDGAIETKPIKGTRPRGADRAEDERLIREARARPKDRAGNAGGVPGQLNVVVDDMPPLVRVNLPQTHDRTFALNTLTLSGRADDQAVLQALAQRAPHDGARTLASRDPRFGRAFCPLFVLRASPARGWRSRPFVQWLCHQLKLRSWLFAHRA